MISSGERLAYAGRLHTLPLPGGEGRSLRSPLPPTHVPIYPFTFGATGSAATNFSNRAFARKGFGEDMEDVQRLSRAGDKDAARRRVPIEIGLGTNLIGTDDAIRARLRLYRDAGVSSLRIGLAAGALDRRLDDLGRLLDLVRDVDLEVAS